MPAYSDPAAHIRRSWTQEAEWELLLLLLSRAHVTSGDASFVSSRANASFSKHAVSKQLIFYKVKSWPKFCSQRRALVFPWHRVRSF